MVEDVETVMGCFENSFVAVSTRGFIGYGMLRDAIFDLCNRTPVIIQEFLGPRMDGDAL